MIPERCVFCLPISRRIAAQRAAIWSLALWASLPAQADQIDPNAVILERLKATPARTLKDGSTLKGVRILGTYKSDGVRFQGFPAILPQRPLALSHQNFTNCQKNNAQTDHAGVDRKSQNSEAFSSSTTFGSSTSLEVSYESPIGLGGKVSQTFSYSDTNGREVSKAEDVSWNAGVNVNLGPREAVAVEFIVAQQLVENVKWSTNVLVAGNVELTYERPRKDVKVCVFAKQGFQGAKKCWSPQEPLEVGNLGEVRWDNGALAGGGIMLFPTVANLTQSISIEGDVKVTFYWDTWFRSWPVVYTASIPYVGKHDAGELKSVRIEPIITPIVVVDLLEKHLTEAQRKIPLFGTYRGVTAVTGSFVAGDTVKLTDSDCANVARYQGPIVGSTTAAVARPGVGAPGALAQGVFIQNVPVDPNAPVLKGKVLAANIKPTRTP